MNNTLIKDEIVVINGMEHTLVNNAESFEDSPRWKVLLPTGTAWMAGFIVQADNIESALDAVVDYCEEKGLSGLYYTYDELLTEDLQEDDYLYAGNSGFYVGIETRIEKLQTKIKGIFHKERVEDMEQIKDLKSGHYFTLKPLEEPKENQVYIKGVYDKSSKTFSCTRFSDANNERFLKADRKVYTDFIF